MGNRAVITDKKNNYDHGLGIYLHWNGGRDSVEAFITYCKLHKYTSISDLYRVIANWSHGRIGELGLLQDLDCDNGDNGLYIIDKWEIVDRKYFNRIEQSEYDLDEFLLDIDEGQPIQEQIRDILTAEPIAVEDIKLGDTILNVDMYGKVESHTIIGFGEDRYVNGHNVKGLPYTDRYGSDKPEDNINNYYLKDYYGQTFDYYKAK
jgi:hypothetical protein